MKTAKSVAMAMSIGYLLGRQHKLRTALLLGGAVATGRLGAKSAQRRNANNNGNADNNGNGDSGGSDSQEAGVLTKLGGAGMAAARAAITKPAERLGTKLAESAEALREAGKPEQLTSKSEQQTDKASVS